jgi:hypothetical protein
MTCCKDEDQGNLGRQNLAFLCEWSLIDALNAGVGQRVLLDQADPRATLTGGHAPAEDFSHARRP